MDDELGAARFARWKFRPPVFPNGVRPGRVAVRLASAIDGRQFVSIVAPAGSGKTTAMAAWSASVADRGPVWVRLDPQDDDPHVLAAVISESILQNLGASAARVGRLLSSSTAPNSAQLARALAMDLDELDRVVLVLDDLHHLRSARSNQFVESLIDEIGASVRVLTASRIEPPFGLPQRRVRRTIAELTASDLLLDRTDVIGLLTEAGVDRDALADVILERSGGWAAAAVLLSAGIPEVGPEGDGLPSVLVGDLDIDHYLRVEVLEHLDPDVRDFVLETSLLASLDAATCAELTRSKQAAELLERIRRRGFVEQMALSPTEPGRAVFRYHDRIASFLRGELAATRSPEERLALHQRAATLSPPMHAVQLLVEVGDVEGAGATIAATARSLLDTPGARVPRSWLSPFEEHQLLSQPWLAALSGLVAVEDGDMATATARLEPAVVSMRESGDHTGFVPSAIGLTEAYLAWGQVGEAAALIDELLDLDLSADERAKVLMAKLWLDYFEGDWALLDAGLDESFSLAFTSCTEIGRCSVALGLGAEFLFGSRGPTWLSDRAAELERRIDNDEMALTNLRLVGAAGHLIAGRIEQAQAVAANLDERALELGSLNWLAMLYDRVRLGLALATDDHPTIDAMVDAARRLLAESDRHHQERGMYAYALARASLGAGRLERLRAARLLLGDLCADDRPDTAVTAAVLDALICRERGDIDEAEAVLMAVNDVQRPMRFCFLTGLVDLELAAVRLEGGRPGDAVETARPMLSMLAQLDGIGLLQMDGRGTHRPVLEACCSDPAIGAFAQRALLQLAAPTAESGLVVPDTGERLTSRELDVLRLVVAGDSNRAIAEQLFIGERTVKSHMTSLMRKLGVTSRTAAVARLRELDLG